MGHDIMIKVQSEMSQQNKLSAPSGNPSGAILMQMLTRGKTGYEVYGNICIIFKTFL